jgi:glycosyltransferase involved in cell wall biosynthesis
MTKKRVLHIINRLNTGGVERWLLGVAEGLQGSPIQLDVLVHTLEPSELDEPFTATGSKIVKCEYNKNPFSYAWRLFKILRSGDKYDVVHSHVDHFSGWVMVIAFFAGVKLRIAHSHSNRRSIEPLSGPRAWYLYVMKWMIRIFANKYLSVSREAQGSQYGQVVPEQRLELLYCGIKHLDNIKVDPSFRETLGIPSDGFVLGHVGRLSEPKNHTFLLKVFAELVKHKSATLVLIGDGELRGDIESEIDSLGIRPHVKLLGMRSDAVDIMASVFDVLLFPSLYEGLPLTLVESQVAGVPALIADNITREAGFDHHLMRYLPLSAPLDKWVSEIFDLHLQASKVSEASKFTQTDFYMPNHLKKLEKLYLES